MNNEIWFISTQQWNFTVIDSVPFLVPPRRKHRRVRAFQGVFLAVFAPLGWIALKSALGAPPLQLVLENVGLFTYMFLGTMAAFGCFGWLLGREEERLSRLAMLDELTGLPNSRMFDQRMEECVQSSRRSGKPLSLLLLDMDRFKNINDTFGHPVGDMALRTAATAIRASIRATDVAARVGGEEFAVILPDTAPAEAAKVAERVLAGIREARLLLTDGRQVKLTASIGLAGGKVSGEDSSFGFIAEADKALYKAKDAGRDCLAVSTNTSLAM
jgi:diguanylate cyclase (GGDEF)-like protein